MLSITNNLSIKEGAKVKLSHLLFIKMRQKRETCKHFGRFPVFVTAEKRVKITLSDVHGQKIMGCQRRIL